MSAGRARPIAWLVAALAVLAVGARAAPSFGAGATPPAPAHSAAKAGHKAAPKPPIEPPANIPKAEAGQAPGAAANGGKSGAASPAGQAQPGPEKTAPEQPQTPESEKPESEGPKPKNLEPIPPGIAVPILGRKVEGPNHEDMGRVVDVLVDSRGDPRAAVIDFGGFLGVGSRKIAVDWTLLRFNPADPDAPIELGLGRDQVQAAPEYERSESKADVVGPPGATPTQPPPKEPPVTAGKPAAPNGEAAPAEQPPAETPAKKAPAKTPEAPPPSTEKPAPKAAPPAKGAHPSTNTPAPSEAPPQKP
jgi:hypothetical protein